MKRQAQVPACWTWGVPAQPVTAEAWFEWHGDRCAICGSSTRGALVEDHDHQTGMVRGYLCRSCNTMEGLRQSTDDVFAKYRQRHPASIAGYVAQYVSPVTGPALPAVRESWPDDPDEIDRLLGLSGKTRVPAPTGHRTDDPDALLGLTPPSEEAAP